MTTPPTRPPLAVATAAVLCVALLSLVTIAIWAPADVRTELLTADGVLAAVALAGMRALFGGGGGGASGDPPSAGAGGAAATLAVIVLAGAIAASTTGCGGAIGTQARAAGLTAHVLAAAGDVADHARDAALDRVEAEHPDRGPERSAALDTEAARWRPVGEALDTARAALLTWIDAIELARLADDDGPLLPGLVQLAARVVALYDRVVSLLDSLGVEGAPPLPDAVRALVGAVTGGAR